MMNSQKRYVWVFSVFIISIFLGESSLAQNDKPTEEQSRFFETKIRPQLIRHCYGCHSARSGKIRGGLRLDTSLGILRGGNSGPAVVPNNLDESLLWNAINHEDFEMPPSEMMPKDVIVDFRNWIETGAFDPRVGETVEIRSEITEKDVEEGREFWSIREPEIVKPSLSLKRDSHLASWPITEIDKYILSGQVENGLEPSGDASPNTILRRLSFDLIGLPPTPDQIKWFEEKSLQDPDQAIQYVVDTYYLKSEQFGERWGRHWLDVARFAESTGKEQNLTFPNAWRYRNYVIDSFNKDKPYDRFIQEQIAGDLLPIKTDEQWTENLIATGFLAIGSKTLVEENKRQFEMDLIDEQIDVTTRVVLGLSVACARCHDHKFDAIPQADYYAMAGIFQSTRTYFGTHSTQQNRNPSSLLQLPVADKDATDITPQQMAALEKQLADQRAELRTIQQEVRKIRSSGNSPDGNARDVIGKAIRMRKDVGILQERVNSFDDRGKAYSYCMATQNIERPADATLLQSGDIDQPGQTVARGFPQLLAYNPSSIPNDSSGRLELARWMTNENSALVARVMVNRIWLHLFGEGIVRSPEEFGATGELPSHPELLDYLAIRFIENGWSVKQLVRDIVSSRVYRLDSKNDTAKFQKDSENKYLWRHSRKRLDAEVIRDSILSVSGNLDLARPKASLVAEVGPSAIRNGILVTVDLNIGGRGGNTKRTTIEQVAQASKYRSVYLPVIRDYPPRSLELFDFADSNMVVGKRDSSNTPDQGLYFLNNPFVIEQSDAMARVLMSKKTKLEDQIVYAFLLAYSREATKSEIEDARKLISNNGSGSLTSNNNFRLKQLSVFCQSIIASAEFRHSN